MENDYAKYFYANLNKKNNAKEFLKLLNEKKLTNEEYLSILSKIQEKLVSEKNFQPLIDLVLVLVEEKQSQLSIIDRFIFMQKTLDEYKKFEESFFMMFYSQSKRLVEDAEKYYSDKSWFMKDYYDRRKKIGKAGILIYERLLKKEEVTIKMQGISESDANKIYEKLVNCKTEDEFKNKLYSIVDKYPSSQELFSFLNILTEKFINEQKYAKGVLLFELLAKNEKIPEQIPSKLKKQIVEVFQKRIEEIDKDDNFMLRIQLFYLKVLLAVKKPIFGLKAIFWRVWNRLKIAMLRKKHKEENGE